MKKSRKILYICLSILLTILTALIVVSCVNSKKTSETKAEDTALRYPSQDGLNGIYDVDTLQDCLVHFDNFITCQYDPYYAIMETDFSYEWNVEFFTTSQRESFTKMRFGQNHNEDGYFYFIDYYRNGGYVPMYYVLLSTPTEPFWHHSYGEEIYITGGSDIANSDTIRWFDHNATLTSYLVGSSLWGSFTFEANFNYNADFNYTLSDTFVSKPGTSATFEVQNEFEQSFISNGQVFNTVLLVFNRVTSSGVTYWNSATQEAYIQYGTDYIYWSEMYYINMFTNTRVLVATRGTKGVQYTGGTSSAGSYSTALTNTVNWVQANYRTIAFPGRQISYDLVNEFTRYNSSSDYNGFTEYPNYEQIINNNDNGEMVGGLALLGLAFKSLTPIFTIQILPGITLGLLFFLPLIVGIIVLIIWVIKR